MVFSKLSKMQSMTMALVLSSMVGTTTKMMATVWLLLEINTVTMCFIMTENNKEEKKSNKNAMEYFLVQVLASAVLMLVVSSYEKSNFSSLVFTMMMMTKMGVWPTHLWYFKIISSMDLKMKAMLLIMSWQKILPLVLLNTIVESEKDKMMLMLLATMSALIPMLKLKKYLSKKTTLALSSINTNGWLLPLAMVEKTKLMLFLLIYLMSMMSVLKNMMKEKNNFKSRMEKSLYALMVMANLSGIPPLPMFWVKITLILSMVMMGIPPLMMIVMLTAACGMTFFYLNMSLPHFMVHNKKNQFNKN